MLAAFHAFAGTEPVTGSLSPADVPSLSGERFLVFDALNCTLRIMGAAERLPVTLAPLGAVLLVILPLDSPFIAVGLADKLLAPLTVEAVCAKEDRCSVRLREGGDFLFFSRRPPVNVSVNGQPASARALPDCPGGYRLCCPAGEGGAEVSVGF